jgi:cell division protein FtsI/penicillin-binding protein 2
LIGRRRTALPLVALALGAGLIIARLFQVQVVESATWTEQAAGLVRSGELVPFRRGEIRDASGALLARDDTAYELVLRYREFRRGFPLAQVAHARAALECRAVPLDEAALHLEAWALELVSLSPRDLDQFGSGAGLKLGGLLVPPTQRPELEERRARSLDVWFYTMSLLGFSANDSRAARKLEGDARARSFLQLAVEFGVAPSPERARAELCARAATALEDLRALALLCAASDAPTEAVSRDDAGWLLAELEAARVSVEDLTASWAFEQATGFAPGRLEPQLLLALDLDWLCAALRWEPRRLHAWAASARARWHSRWLLGYAADAIAAECARLPGRNWPPEWIADHVLSLCASAWASSGLERALDDEPQPWREVARVLGWSQLGEIFAAGSRAERIDAQNAQPLPFFDPALRDTESDPAHPWLLLERATGGADWGEAFALARERERTTALRSRVAALLSGWEARLQLALRRRIESRLGAAEPGSGGARRLEMSADCIRRAMQGLPYALKDYGSREVALVARPAFEAIALIERAPSRLRGFHAREESRREHVRANDEPIVAGWTLLGSVGRALDVGADALSPARRERLVALRRAPERDEDEERELAELVGDALLAEQSRGVAGIEACFDPWLRGKNGYRERLSLEDAAEDGGLVHRVREVEHGRVLGLTLDVAAQRAAERVLASPDGDPDAHFRDEEWLAAPRGAIVLMTVDGAIGAAASGPLPRVDPSELTREEYAQYIERALHAPGFQPLGSVVKPLEAAWALDKLALDPRASVMCSRQSDGYVGYKGLRCSEGGSHGGQSIDLFHALLHSCNSYFAWLGERSRGRDLLDAWTCFGLGEATGVRPPGAGGRIEDVPRLPLLAAVERDRMRAANGLVVLQGTPLQVARAFAGLATGVLPSARLVETIGGEPAPRGEPLPLPLSQPSLETVQAALRAVAGETGGTGHRALDANEVGYTIAAKTGSADLEDRPDDLKAKVRKHAWVAGWLPADRPRVVFVVFCADTRSTSSHSAVWLARQLLRDADVRRWIDAQIAKEPAR